jgi:hypothetical protein
VRLGALALAMEVVCKQGHAHRQERDCGGERRY